MINVLIVEDEALISRYLEKLVRNYGYSVLGKVYSGKDALQLIEKYTPDLILMDIVLQGNMDGIHVAKKITEKHVIPIIFISAFNDEKTIKRASETKAYGFINKPVDPNILDLVIKGALLKHKQDEC